MKQKTIKILTIVFVVCLVGLSIAVTTPVIWTLFPSARPLLRFFAGQTWIFPTLIVGLVGSGVWCRALESKEAGD